MRRTAALLFGHNYLLVLRHPEPRLRDHLTKDQPQGTFLRLLCCALLR